MALDNPSHEAARTSILSKAWFYTVTQFTDEEMEAQPKKVSLQGHVNPEPRPPTSQSGVSP